MTPAELYQAMALPSSTALGKRVFKKLFLEHASLTAADKRALTEDVDQVIWQFALKPETLALKPYVDDTREYLEIAVLEVQLTARKNALRIAEVIHRAIPYPIVLVLSESEGLALSLAHKRMSRSEQEAVVAEPPLHGPWLDGPMRTPIERAFLDNLSLSGLSQAHALDLYSAIAARVLALIISEVTGRFSLSEVSEGTRREHLAQCRALERELAQVRASLHAESSFARKLELNTNVKTLERRLAELTTTL